MICKNLYHVLCFRLQELGTELGVINGVMNEMYLVPRSTCANYFLSVHFLCSLKFRNPDISYFSPQLFREESLIALVSESSNLFYRENSPDCSGSGPLSALVNDFF